MELPINYAGGRISIFDFKLFNHQMTDVEIKMLNFEVILKNLPKLPDLTMIIRSPCS